MVLGDPSICIITIDALDLAITAGVNGSDIPEISLIILAPLSITFDIRFPETKLNKAYELLALFNENLWIGHFDITSKNGIPAFRHTILSNYESDVLHKKFEDLVDIGIYECEKFYPSFQQVLFDDTLPKQAIKFSEFEIIGRA